MKNKVLNIFKTLAASLKSFLRRLPRSTLLVGSYVLVIALLFGAFYWRTVSSIPDFDTSSREEEAAEEEEEEKEQSDEAAFYSEPSGESLLEVEEGERESDDDGGQPPEKAEEPGETAEVVEEEHAVSEEEEIPSPGDEEEEAAASIMTAFPVEPLPEWEVVRSFGSHKVEELPSGSKLHSFTGGVDLSSADSAPVAALWEGTIKKINEHDSLYGKSLLLSHQGEVASFYGNLGEIWVREGQQVARGEHLGKLHPAPDKGGDSFLYLEVLEKGKRVDPLDLFKEVARH